MPNQFTTQKQQKTHKNSPTLYLIALTEKFELGNVRLVFVRCTRNFQDLHEQAAKRNASKSHICTLRIQYRARAESRAGRKKCNERKQLHITKAACVKVEWNCGRYVVTNYGCINTQMISNLPL